MLTLQSLLSLSSPCVCSVLFPLQGSFLPSMVPIAETPLEFYVVWVQRHRNQSSSQILLERHPPLGQRRWGGSPSRNLAALPTTVCVEEFGVWGAVPWQINHYKVTSEMLSFLCYCDTQTTFLSSSLSLSSSPSLNPAHLCGSVLGPLLPPLSLNICVSGVDSAVGKPPAKLGSLQCFGQICLSNLTHLLSLLKISSVPLTALLPLS